MCLCTLWYLCMLGRETPSPVARALWCQTHFESRSNTIRHPASGGLNESHNRETSRRETRPNHRRSAASPQGGPRRGRPSSISLPLRKDAAVEEGLALVEEAHRDLRRWALFRVRAVGEDDALLPSSLVDVMVLSGIARCLLRDFDSEPCLLLPGEEAADVVIVVANL